MQREQVRLRSGRALLGELAHWGKVGYAGRGFAPALGTYRGINAMRAKITTVADSGRSPCDRSRLANLYPLAAAALYEVAFAREAGPLATWRN